MKSFILALTLGASLSSMAAETISAKVEQLYFSYVVTAEELKLKDLDKNMAILAKNLNHVSVMADLELSDLQNAYNTFHSQYSIGKMDTLSTLDLLKGHHYSISTKECRFAKLNLGINVDFRASVTRGGDLKAKVQKCFDLLLEQEMKDGKKVKLIESIYYVKK